jgi:hypothetical protein
MYGPEYHVHRQLESRSAVVCNRKFMDHLFNGVVGIATRYGLDGQGIESR